jgi:phosphoribosylanthranilate isomerase
VSVLVKLCGLTDEAAVEAAVACGADALGFVRTTSARHVTLARMRQLLRLVPPGIERVAVFARASRSELEDALALGIDALEAEAGSAWPELPAHVFALPVLRDGPDLLARARGLPSQPARPGSLAGTLVVDGPSGGGRGLPVDFARARELARLRPIVLAGGLTPENVALRVGAVRPVAVTVSSGIERVHGRKDVARILAFVRAVRAREPLARESRQ